MVTKKNTKKSVKSSVPELVPFCPQCNSTQINRPLEGVGYICVNCGHKAEAFPQIESTDVAKLIVKNMPEIIKVDLTRYEHFMWRFMGPLWVLVGIFMIITFKDKPFLLVFLPVTFFLMGIVCTYFGFRKRS